MATLEGYDAPAAVDAALCNRLVSVCCAIGDVLADPTMIGPAVVTFPRPSDHPDMEGAVEVGAAFAAWRPIASDAATEGRTNALLALRQVVRSQSRLRTDRAADWERSAGIAPFLVASTIFVVAALAAYLGATGIREYQNTRRAQLAIAQAASDRAEREATRVRTGTLPPPTPHEVATAGLVTAWADRERAETTPFGTIAAGIASGARTSGAGLAIAAMLAVGILSLEKR